MKKSRLIHILKTFNKKEVRELRKWLLSPAHNQREDVLHLFEYLFEKNHLERDKYLEKEKVFPNIYPKDKYDDAKMRQVIHFLFKAVESFLVYEDLKNDHVKSEITLARVYRKRNLNKLCESTLKNAEALHEKSVFRNVEFFRDDYHLQLERYNYIAGFRRQEVNLQGVSNALDATYFADKLQQSCFMLAHEAVTKKEYDKGPLQEILTYIEQKNFLTNHAIAVYYYGFKALTNRDEEHFFYSLKNEIQAFGNYFPAEELRTLYLLAINYCIGRVNRGKNEFYREIFELYKTGMEERILFENNQITHRTFLNVTTNGILLKEYEWASMFIEEYQQFMEEKHRENTVHYCLARLNFEKRNYKTAMRLLVQYDSDEIVMSLNAKSMLLKMYFELDELDALDSSIESMRAYLKRKQIMGYHRAPMTNFIQLLKKLVKVNPFDKSEKATLKVEVQDTSPLLSPDKNWLLTQIDQL